MIWLKKGRIPAGKWPFLTTAYNSLREIEETLVNQLDLTEGTGQLTITGCMQAYRYAVIRRVLDLAQATVACWNEGALVGSVVCARSLLETIAIYHSFLNRVEPLVAAGEWGRIGDLVDAYAFSTQRGPGKRSKSQDHPPRVRDAINQFIKSTQPNMEQFWEQICDTAHPNGKSMLDLGGKLSEFKYHARHASDNESLLFIAVFNCLYSCCWLSASDLDFHIYVETVRTGKVLPSDHKLVAERALIHEVTDKLMSDKEFMKAISATPPGPAKKTRDQR